MKMFDISDKVIVVTGAGQGIGMHLSNRLYELGAEVIAVDKSFPNADYKFDIRFVGDLSDLETVENLMSNIENNFGKIDVLINNAGITKPSQEIPYPEENWSATLEINLSVPYRLSSQALDLLKRSKNPSVVNIASLNASLAFPNNPAYVASKTGIVGLTRSMALDFGNLGIRFNSVSPGYIRTEMTGDSWKDPQKRIERKNRTVLGRWGTPEDLVGMIVYLSSDSSSYVTGQDFLIDGGWSIKGL